MQRLSWYLHRLRAMSADELAWRARAAARSRIDHVRVTLNAYPSDRSVDREAQHLATTASPRLTDLKCGAWTSVGAGEAEVEWRQRLRTRADAIARHRIDLFGRERDLGAPIDWNRDHVLGKATPLWFADSIDYRDPRIAGDAKVVWEPNRHQHLVVLARAYRATGERQYAQAVVDQLTSWLDQCPFGRGMNWRSPLELALRLINWTWAIDFIRDSECLTLDFCNRFVRSAYAHLWDITRKYSRGSSANNHLIGEAAGVFVASSYFQGLRGADAWQAQAFDVLCREIITQTHADGGSAEQATSYHLFSLQLLLVAALAGRATGREFPAVFWRRLELMMEFAGALSEGGPLPSIGDSDDGYVLDLGRDHDDVHAVLSIGAVLFERADFKRWAARFREPGRWLLGADGPERFSRLALSTPMPLASRAFPESGYYILQCGTPHSADSVSAILDCGPLGFSSIAAHGHADALSFVLRAFGREILVDPGTFDYFLYPEWRTYFRSTAAHNTVEIDGLDQSMQLGAFLWGRGAQARCLDWRPLPDGGAVEGEHDGYGRLPDPVVHRRRLELHGDRNQLIVRDELFLRAPHVVAIFFHVAEDCVVAPVSNEAVDIRSGPHRVRLTLDKRLSIRIDSGAEAPIRGWVSRKYHLRQPATTVSGSIRTAAPIALTCQFEFVPRARLCP